MRKENCHEQDVSLFDGKALGTAGAVIGFQNLVHILLIVRAAHCLTAAVDGQRAGTLELPNQTNRVVLVVVQGNKADNPLQDLGTERINVALPCFCQNAKRIDFLKLMVFRTFTL